MAHILNPKPEEMDSEAANALAIHSIKSLHLMTGQFLGSIDKHPDKDELYKDPRIVFMVVANGLMLHSINEQTTQFIEIAIQAMQEIMKHLHEQSTKAE